MKKIDKKEQILLGISLAGIGVAGYFGFKQIKFLKNEIEILKQDGGNMYQQFSRKIEMIDIDLDALAHHVFALENNKEE